MVARDYWLADGVAEAAGGMNPMNEDITVVCSAWHKQQHLDQYFRQHSQALLRQTIPVKIIYVCDGGMSLEAPGPGVTMVTVSEGIRTAEAFNLGLALANTPFFATLNIDDFFFRNALEVQVGAMKQIGCDAFYGDWEVRFTTEGDIERDCFGLEQLRPCLDWPPEKAPGLRLGNGDGQRGTWGPAPIFRTEAIRSVGGFPKTFGDGTPIPTIIDFIVWHRMLEARKTVSRGELVVGSYYSNPETQQEFRGGSVPDEHKRYEQFGVMA
jgi:hypothetical protein